MRLRDEVSYFAARPRVPGIRFSLAWISDKSRTSSPSSASESSRLRSRRADRHRARSRRQRVFRRRQVRLQKIRQEPAHQRADGRILGQLATAVSHLFHRRRHGGRRLEGMETDDRQARRQHPTRWRRSIRHQYRPPQTRHRRRYRQFDSDQGESDRHADGNPGRHADGRQRTATRRSFPTAPARPKIRLSPTWPWPPTPARSRPVPPAAPIASRNTISSCASKSDSGSAAQIPRQKGFRQ